MLRIIAKLDHIKMAIVAAHQVTLCATPHPANVLDRRDWQMFASIKSLSS
jgi:hypothetical protein